MRSIALLLASVLVGALAVQAHAATYHAYVGTAVGTYGRPWVRSGMSMGGEIYLVDFDSDTGALSNARVVAFTPANVGWMLVDPQRSVLYVANETAAGSVSAYAIAPGTGALTLINNQPTQGSPVSVAMDPSGRYLVAGNFGGGSVAVFPIKAGGALGEMSDFFQCPSASSPTPGEPDPARPPQIHFVTFDPTGKFVVANDHGRNKVFVFTLDLATGKLVPAPSPYVQVTAGDAPRHGQFSPDGKSFFDLTERDGKVLAYDFAPATGKLTLRQTVSALPDDFKGADAAAELLISKDGRYLYATTRGHDTIVTLKVGADGKVALVGETSAQSPRPRTIAFDPSGHFLVSAVEEGNEVAAFRIDPNTGMATYAKQALALKDLWSIAFLPPQMGR
jgi:6-phosphogluconolactonase (cycloisomerase 2 family)